MDGVVEQDYFKAIDINSRVCHLRIRVKKGDENSFDQRKHDEIPVWVILDVDALTSSDTRFKKMQRIKRESSKQEKAGNFSGVPNLVFHNNFSFETFLLLHVTDFQTPVTDKYEYDPFMREHFGIANSWADNKNPNNRKKVCAKIDDASLRTAKRRARKMSSSIQKNPSTTMDSFFSKSKLRKYDRDDFGG